MEDRKVQAFVGSQSTQQNLVNMVTKAYLRNLRAITERDKSFVLSDLEPALGRIYLDKIWEMIMRRWQYIDDLRNS